MPIYERFDTVVVPFPFAEIPVNKRRPVAVLSGATFNALHGATLVGMITTAKASTWPSDIRISDLDIAGLKVPSVLRFRLVTLPNDLFIRPLGKLSAVDRLHAERQVAEMLIG